MEVLRPLQSTKSFLPHLGAPHWLRPIWLCGELSGSCVCSEDSLFNECDVIGRTAWEVKESWREGNNMLVLLG